ncbi:MAG: spore maturation protein [Firmicutes bacterium]|nr:spore maturation protein [Bacillota bacterium]
MIRTISNLIIPLMVLFIIFYGVLKKVDVYDTFVDGAKESFDMILTMFPPMLAMIVGVNVFVKSGALNYVFQFLNPIFEFIHFPIDILPMAIMRPISGTASLALLNQIFESSGPDSFLGRLASIIQGSTDTTFYILTLYFGTIGIKKIRYSLWAGLFADLVGIIASVLLVGFLFH